MALAKGKTLLGRARTFARGIARFALRADCFTIGRFGIGITPMWSGVGSSTGPQSGHSSWVDRPGADHLVLERLMSSGTVDAYGWVMDGRLN